MIIKTLLFLLFSVSLSAVELTSENLTSYENQTIQVRGFLYKDPSGEIALASQPNLKSCCIRSISNITVKSETELIQTERAVTLEGVLKGDGQGYVLENAKMMDEEKFPVVALMMCGLIILALGLACRINSTQRRQGRKG